MSIGRQRRPRKIGRHNRDLNENKAFKREQNRIYRLLKRQDKYEIATESEKKSLKMSLCETEFAHLSRVLHYRALTLGEATTLYYVAKHIDMLDPLSDCLEKWGNDYCRSSDYAHYKRDFVRACTWNGTCPRCQEDTESNNSRWYIEEKYILPRTLKVCLWCYNNIRKTDICHSIFWQNYVNAYSAEGPDVAYTVFARYIPKGIIFDPSSKEQQEQANCRRFYYKNIIMESKKNEVEYDAYWQEWKDERERDKIESASHLTIERLRRISNT